ncbi:P-loop containing nucleoside triphosphate hydrolase protein [Aspergillus homomorphus CBS 101889]|uniref:P-loop containing nucleoside triphosphate hydrolase protein n=1 Tax=Aspergillus homomorphus (strain CBS 101889) TaxID=1450537 RepID=A0A395HZU2_ASPHC|nr:P-loop containing nucleoside triphosphate hydrolase protein [Aspergillus homomorphus CBS 101889]RAL12903.1 P-loop containing nucleoside triphosphate hydrolase protein [Aspergillus homomorphus CBS 101889]
MCAWENEFRKQVDGLRKIELSKLRVRFLWWSVSMTVFYSLPFITTILILFLYAIVEGQRLETKVAFPALATFAVLRIPLDRMSSMISFLLQAHFSVGRIEAFLEEKDTERYNQIEWNDNHLFGFRDATFQWPTARAENSGAQDHSQLAERSPTPPFRLSNINITFLDNGLNLVIGASGSGKSSLLLALLGEMELLQGRVFLPLRRQTSYGIPDLTANFTPDSSIAYCPQEPWILNQSVRANILFGLPLDKQRYRMVLEAVALISDLAKHKKGDPMMAGERGNRLSGGQKQRVALARALYSNAQVVVLDDCLSALDSRTGRHLFFQGIKGQLMQGRTCILATHHTQLVVSHADYIVMIDHGEVQAQGTASDLIRTGLLGDSMIDPEKQACPQGQSSKAKIATSFESQSASEEMDSEDETDSTEVKAEPKPQYREEKSAGAVPWQVIKTYFASMGSWWFWSIVLVAFAVQQITSLATNLWIKDWAQAFDRLPKPSPGTNEGSAAVNSGYYLAIYGFICLAYALTSFFRDLITFSGALRASARMFDSLLDSILHARLTFFDKIPFKQITNRFSRDIEAIDQEVTPHSKSTFYTFCSLATVIVLISAMLPVFLPAAAIICFAYYIITVVYINSARDLKRIEAVQRSPMYQHFGEALAGYVSVRAYGRVAQFTNQIHDFTDAFNQPYMLLWAAKEWLTFRIACLSALISWLTGTILLWSLGRGAVSPGIAGLVLTASTPLSEWLSTVSFRAYTTRYAPELDPVLSEVTFQATAGQRLAVVGRTGAGKSTLALALIRGLEASSGQILIDGVDIAAVPLVRLRRAVTMGPQDPTLFQGNLRDNLDPLHRHADPDLYQVLHQLHFFQTLPNASLDHPSAVLSLGQRQLICIARALLRRSRVLVLDEATASMDHATDSLIQASLRSSIATGTTVITIAHRLITIADYDHVVMLDAGRVVEQGSVAELLLHRGDAALFRAACEQSGDLELISRTAAGCHID